MDTLDLDIAGGQKVFRPQGIQYRHIVADSPDHPRRGPPTEHGRNAPDQSELSDLTHQHSISPCFETKQLYRITRDSPILLRRTLAFSQ
jgi:hypothetical protein